MVSSLYSDAADLASDLLTEFGQQVTIKRVVAETIDEVTGAATGGSVQSQTVYAAVLPASKGTVEAFDNRIENGVLIDSFLRFVIAPASQFTWMPKPNDHVYISSEDLLGVDDWWEFYFEEIEDDDLFWQIIGVTPVNPAGTPIVYKFALRR